MSDPLRTEKVRACLLRAFNPTSLTVLDESHLHAGHAGAAGGMGHFRVKIESQRFAGLNTLARHRLVYAAMGELLNTDVHALAIEAHAPAAGAR